MESTFIHELKTECADRIGQNIEVSSERFRFIFNSQILVEEKTISECGLLSGSTLVLVYDHNTFSSAVPTKKIKFQQETAQITAVQSHAPILTKAGYQCTPSIAELQQLTEDELSRVPNFQIYNQHVAVRFEAPVDLRSANLDNSVILIKKSVDIYPDMWFKNSGVKKPEVGSGLNQPATVTYENFRDTEAKHPEKFTSSLIKWTKRRGIEFVEWNKERN